MPLMHVCLFDIDGTLLNSGGAGKAAMEAGLAGEFHLDRVQQGVPYSGRTDRAIGRDLLAVHGIDPTSANAQKLQDAYLAALRSLGLECDGRATGRPLMVCLQTFR